MLIFIVLYKSIHVLFDYIILKKSPILYFVTKYIDKKLTKIKCHEVNCVIVIVQITFFVFKYDTNSFNDGRIYSLYIKVQP